ncbi:MATE family efflux transporter [Robbsia sp. Bb-Pol-6]|uniref:Multidrug-efflux transporter n=1 Tax=Robbsia betulipollinis TaxID=2981849 RepID=A0ABT3ZNE3_9BURK|nr:MATE family efflux transporter [Robbsia betulipollinis]MCY0387842.1 MATE family efflux transporter [Robbsia betulipollinis]
MPFIPFPPFPPSIRLEARLLLRLAVPIIAAQLSATGMSLIDVLLAGHLGVHVLASVAMGASIWSLALATIQGVLLSVPTAVAQLNGAGQRREIWVLFRQALWLAAGIGVGMGLVVAIGGPYMLATMGVAPELVEDGSRFLRAIALGAPALAVLLSCRGLSEGLSIARPSFWFGLLGPLLLAPVAWSLMYGRFGFPALGVLGSGIATALVLWIQALGFLCYVAFHPRYRGLGQERPGYAPSWPRIAELLRVGIPMGMTLLMEVGLFIATALVIGRLGDRAVAMHQIAMNVITIAFMVPLGLSMAITVRVADARGRRDAAGVRRAACVGMGLALGLQLVSGSVMLLLPGAIVSLYTDSTAIVAGATLLLQLAGLFQISDGLQVAGNGALRGLKDTRIPMFLTLFAYWGVGMPVGIWLSIHRGDGAPGMWIGLLAGLSTAAILLWTRFFRLTRGWDASGAFAARPLSGK